MTAEIVNLRKARKAKARAEREAQAAANRLRFGRSKAERSREEAETVRHERSLDGARLPMTRHDRRDEDGGS
ncbi:MAG: DUF4169 family protein [Parvularculaceae bacterium]|nr:DUF4169 family protein [Parvularculaceae bacterium]